MTAKKKSSYKHGNYKALTKNKSFITSVVALMLLILGVGSALALSEMSQDTRGNAATLVRETDRFKSGMLNKPDSQSKTDAEKKAEIAQKKDADAESAKKAALEAKDKAKADAEKKAEIAQKKDADAESAKKAALEAKDKAKADAEKKAEYAAMKDAEARNARIAAEKAKSAAQQNEKSGTRVAPPTQEDKRGTPANPEAPAKTIVTHTPTPSIPQQLVAAAKTALGKLIGGANDTSNTDNPGNNSAADNNGNAADDEPSGGGGDNGGGGDYGTEQQFAQTVFPNATAPLELVLLNQTKTVNGKYKSRLVSKISQPDITLGGTNVVGEIYNSSGSNRKVLHECYIAIWDDYMVASTDSTAKPANWCVKYPEEVYKGVIGQLSSVQTATNSKPLKECFDETNLNHFYVTNADGCKTYAASMTPTPSVRESWTYGYIH